MKLPSWIPSVHRRVCLGRIKIVVIVFILILSFICSVFIIPIRNVVFYPALHYAWRDIPTAKLLSIHYSSDINPDGLFCSVACYELRKPTFSSSDLNVSNMLAYPNLESDDWKMEVMQRQHGRFLPALNMTQKVDLLLVYSVLVEALDAVEVKHFLVAGTLLGLVRHGGLIPWDDDVDISIHITHWELVKQTLACVKGFTLTIFYHLHWKFHYTGSEYPFIDIFFHEMDESYVWSLTYYIRRTFIYPTKYVFPLSTGTFEGLTVPVPRDSLRIVRQIYNYDTCNAYQGHINSKNHTLLNNNPLGFSVNRVDCRDLSYLYNMTHLGES